MTSRTFAYSRHRRRRIVPLQDAFAVGPGEELERRPAGRRDAAGVPIDPATHAAGARPVEPRLPHEHDEYADTPAPPRQPIVQAQRDLASGQVDTDLRRKASEVFDHALRGRRAR